MKFDIHMNSPQIKPTSVEICRPAKRILPSESITLLGSCFATEIGSHLADSGLDICVNPFGVLYNPASIARSLRMLLDGTQFTPADVIPRDTNPVSKVSAASSPAHRGSSAETIEPTSACSDSSTQPPQTAHRPIAPDGGGFVSFFHHGSFARRTPEEFLDNANSAIQQAAEHLRSSQWVIVTFGTAWVYRHLERDIIVSNCHKHPAWEFRREFLSVEEIVSLWSGLLESIPDKQFIFTVSPIRHRKDGMHGNQLSKATLLLAIDRLAALYPDRIHYFPAYEIVLDELRDYSWYNEDGVHLSMNAIQFVCQRFLQNFSFSKSPL